MLFESRNTLENILLELSTVDHFFVGRAWSKHILLGSSTVEYMCFGRARSKKRMLLECGRKTPNFVEVIEKYQFLGEMVGT